MELWAVIDRFLAENTGDLRPVRQSRDRHKIIAVVKRVSPMFDSLHARRDHSARNV